jgi:rsbT co-antagonist protein RsbR
MPDVHEAFIGDRLHLTDHDIERRKKFVGFEPADSSRIAAVRDVVTRNADRFTAVFFASLEGIEEAAGLLSRRRLLEEAKRLKRDHLLAMVAGVYDEGYVQQRIKLALLYSQAGLDVCVFLGVFHQLMRTVGDEIMQNSGLSALQAFDGFMALKKVAFFDIGIMVDLLIDERERVIKAQEESIREMSTPVLQLRDRLLVLPVIGMFDTQRAKQLTDSLLHAIRTNRAKVAVMDITGVPAVDSKVANHLMQTVAAARLMGAQVIVTGLSADVAQSLVALGVDLSRINTHGDLQGGLEEAERVLGNKKGVPGEPVARLERV